MRKRQGVIIHLIECMTVEAGLSQPGIRIILALCAGFLLCTFSLPAQNRQRLSWPVNSEKSELSPTLSVDGSIMIFQSDREDGKGSYDVYETRWLKGKWQAPLSLENINTPYFEGYPRLSPDGNTLFFSTNRHRKDKRSKDLNIWISIRNEQGIFQPPQEFIALNSAEFDASPTFSADNRIVYFCSTRKGGAGGADIFMSQLVDNGWTTPQPLGSAVNTSADELNPQLLLSGDRLFFSSNREGGKGGYDLYSSSRSGAEASWRNAMNAGELFNNEDNLAHFSIQENSGLIYYSAGKLDEEEIFQQGALELGINPVVLLTGTVSEKVSERPISRIMLTVLNLRPTKHKKTDFLFPEKTNYLTDENGRFVIYLPRGQKLVVAIDEASYAPYRKVFDLREQNVAAQLREYILLLPRPSGDSVPGAFFHSNETTPTEESLAALDILIAKWKLSAEKIYLHGMIDSRESLKENNRGLGFKRAATVKAYILSKGIGSERVFITGQSIGGPNSTRFNEKSLARQRIVEIKTVSR